MDIAQRFAQNLIEQREKVGLTPKELAARAALPLVEIESAEAGEEIPCLEALIKLAGSLGISLDELTAGLYPRS